MKRDMYNSLILLWKECINYDFLVLSIFTLFAFIYRNNETVFLIIMSVMGAWGVCSIVRNMCNDLKQRKELFTTLAPKDSNNDLKLRAKVISPLFGEGRIVAEFIDDADWNADLLVHFKNGISRYYLVNGKSVAEGEESDNISLFS